eukprot:1369537-Amorphochlora_amoeboformis.AAC.1
MKDEATIAKAAEARPPPRAKFRPKTINAGGEEGTGEGYPQEGCDEDYHHKTTSGQRWERRG